MQFGVILPNYGAQAGRLATVDTTLAAERLGFDSAWLTDHLALPEDVSAAYTPIFEALTTLGYLAGLTAHIKLGVSALVLPQRNPYEVGKELATLDVLSGARTMLAVGIGWSQGEYQNLGYTFQDRGARMDEAIQVLRTVWRGSRVVSYQGKHYKFEKAAFVPGPLQPGGPPLWVAGNSPRALRRAVLLADGWHPVDLPPGEIERMLRVVQPLLGQRPFSVAPRLRLAFAPEPLEGVPLSGTPARVVEGLRAYANAGVNYAVLHFLAESQAERERAMTLFARQVLPQLAGS
jgi:probable F420-dependent oxidoreductase